MVYEFICEKHGVFEKSLKFTENLRYQNCPVCKEKSGRKYSPVGVVFKGDGFYVTDNPSAKKSTV